MLYHCPLTLRTYEVRTTVHVRRRYSHRFRSLSCQDWDPTVARWRTKMEVSMIEVGPPSSKRHFCSFETELSIFCQRRSFASGIPMCSALLTQVWMTMLYAFDAYIICLICLCLQSWSLLNMYAVDSMIFREKNLKTTINWPSYLLCEDATTCRSC